MAEMLGAAGLLAFRTGKEVYLTWYETGWKYALAHFIDPEGGWFVSVLMISPFDLLLLLLLLLLLRLTCCALLLSYRVCLLVGPIVCYRIITLQLGQSSPP